MSPQTIGWVMDKDTSTRRVHLYKGEEGIIGLMVEESGEARCEVLLDLEGVRALHGYVVQAWQELTAEKGA